jgi:hypothetical protein
MPLLTGTAAILAAVITIGLRSRLGIGRALMVALAATVLSISTVGLLCLDGQALTRTTVLGGLLVAVLGWTLVVAWLRARWPARAADAWDRTQRLGLLGLLVVLVIGTGIRLDPSPYLHGGQDQGIYVNVGHHMARTGRLRPVDRVMAGNVAGVSSEAILGAHKIVEQPEGSPLVGVREGRWIAGLHVEDASEGRIVPAFFHLLPVWFALAELDFGFARSTWPLVLFASLSLLAAFALGHRLAAGDATNPEDRARGIAVGLIAATSLAVHPLDLWISTFTVTENLARAALLGAAALSLEAGRAERRGESGAVLLGALAGLLFAAGTFTRGSMLALAIVLALVLVLVRRGSAPRSHTALLVALVVGTTLAAVQAILHSWPYFFSAASNHFYVPRMQPRKAEAVAWAVVAGALVLSLDRLVLWARGRWLKLDDHTDRVARFFALSAVLLSMVAVVVRAFDGSDDYAANQQVVAVLLRYCGPVGLALGAAGLLAGAWRADAKQLVWVLLAAVILLGTAQKHGIRYEFYYARYLVGDVIPVLVIAGAWLLGESARRMASRFGARVAALGLGVMLLACWVPNVRTLDRPVYWTRDLEHAADDLTQMFELVPEGSLLFFDARAPGRWRGILAVPALLSFDQNVLVYPSGRMIERAVSAGTPVYMLSGGWESSDDQRWPTNGPWRTTVVARGDYRARRAEIIEGGMPEQLTEWGGPWELQRIDPSVWRGSGAFSLHPGSKFVAVDEAGRLESVALELRWEPGAHVELHVRQGVLTGCELEAKLVGERQRAWSLEIASLASDRVVRFSLPTLASISEGGQPITAALALSWRCEDAREVAWQRLSLRWDPK